MTTCTHTCAPCSAQHNLAQKQQRPKNYSLAHRDTNLSLLPKIVGEKYQTVTMAKVWMDIWRGLNPAVDPDLKGIVQRLGDTWTWLSAADVVSAMALEAQEEAKEAAAVRAQNAALMALAGIAPAIVAKGLHNPWDERCAIGFPGVIPDPAALCPTCNP